MVFINWFRDLISADHLVRDLTSGFYDEFIVRKPISSSFWGYERKAPSLCNWKFDQKLPSVILWLASFVKRAETKSFAFLSNRSGKTGSFIKIPMKTSSWLFPTNGSWPTKLILLFIELSPWRPVFLTKTWIFNKNSWNQCFIFFQFIKQLQDPNMKT